MHERDGIAGEFIWECSRLAAATAEISYNPALFSETPTVSPYDAYASLAPFLDLDHVIVPSGIAEIPPGYAWFSAQTLNRVNACLDVDATGAKYVNQAFARLVTRIADTFPQEPQDWKSFMPIPQPLRDTGDLLRNAYFLPHNEPARELHAFERLFGGTYRSGRLTIE